MVVRPVLDHSPLELAQPRPDGEPQFREPVLSDVDMGGLLDRESKGRSEMLEYRRPDPECRFAMEDALDSAPGSAFLSVESALQAKARGLCLKRGIDFGHHEDEVAEVTT